MILNKIRLPKAVKDKIEEIVPGLLWTRALMTTAGFVAGTHINGPQCFMSVEWPLTGVFYSRGTKAKFYVVTVQPDETKEVVIYDMLAINNKLISCEETGYICHKAWFDWEKEEMHTEDADGVITWL